MGRVLPPRSRAPLAPPWRGLIAGSAADRDARRLAAEHRWQESLHRLHLVDEVARVGDSPADCLQAALATLTEASESGAAALFCHDAGHAELGFVLLHGEARHRPGWPRGARGPSVVRWVAEHGEIVSLDEARADPRFHPDVDQPFERPTRSLLAAPVLAAGVAIAVLALFDKRRGARFERADRTRLHLTCRAAAPVVRRMTGG